MLIRDGLCCRVPSGGQRSSVVTRPSGTTSAELDAGSSLMSGVGGGLGPAPGPGRRRWSRSQSIDATLVVATGCTPHMAALLAQHAMRRASMMIAIEMDTGPAHPHPQVQSHSQRKPHSLLQPHPQLQSLTSAPAECPPGHSLLATAPSATAAPTPPSYTSANPSAGDDPAYDTRAGHALELASRTSSVVQRVCCNCNV